MRAIKRSSKKRQFPVCKLAPKLNSASETGATGFTPNEVMALRNIIRIIRRRLTYHTVNIFTEFFSKNEMLLSRYRYSDKLDIHELVRHMHRVIDIYHRFAEEMADNSNVLFNFLAEMEAGHSLTCVSMQDVTLMINAINAYFLRVLHSVNSPTLGVTLNKFRDAMLGTLLAEFRARIANASKFLYLTSEKYNKIEE